MNINREEIDGLIFVVQNPDYICPASSCILQAKLDLSKNCAAIDVNHGCAGYIYGLWLAGSLIESGACRKILLLAGDSLKTPPDLVNKVTWPLFGNAGSATLIEYSEQETLSSFIINTDGRRGDALTIPAGGARLPVDKDILDTVIEDSKGNKWRLDGFFMDGLKVFEFAVSEVPASINALMAYAGITDADIDYYVLHQANKQIIETIALALNMPGDKYSAETFSVYGNQSSVSIPAQIAHILRDKVTSGSQKLLMAGFGIGLAWGSAYLTLDRVYCPEISVRKFDNIPTREDIIKCWTERIKD